MAKIPNKIYPPLTLSSRMTRGKYIAFTLKEVITNDPNYIEWCIENLENFELDNEAYEMFTRYIDMEKSKKFNLD